MDELNRWSDNAPTLRRYEVRFDGGQSPAYYVRVWDALHHVGEGEGHSLNFAAVKALIAYDASEVPNR